jgi:NAD(P)-dependent dehydrogenase (short-subunit alcohol dehydrogenase family)
MSLASSDMDGKVAIVTGSHRGIGWETARVLADAGAKVVLADLPGTPLEEAAARIGDSRRVAHHALDISDEAGVKRLMGFTVATFGRLDALDNNAARQGLPQDVDVVSMDVELWDCVFAVNARGAMLMCKHAIPAMIESGGGSIVNTSSGAATGGNLRNTAYACTKGAIETLTRHVATQYGEHGVRCNAIAPGLIATEMLGSSLPAEIQDRVVEHKLVGRLGEPLDVAQAVLFLLSDRSAFITGHLLRVDGGFYAHTPTLAADRHAAAGDGDSLR